MIHRFTQPFCQYLDQFLFFEADKRGLFPAWIKPAVGMMSFCCIYLTTFIGYGTTAAASLQMVSRNQQLD